MVTNRLVEKFTYDNKPTGRLYQEYQVISDGIIHRRVNILIFLKKRVVFDNVKQLVFSSFFLIKKTAKTIDVPLSDVVFSNETPDECAERLMKHWTGVKKSHPRLINVKYLELFKGGDDNLKYHNYVYLCFLNQNQIKDNMFKNLTEKVGVLQAYDNPEHTLNMESCLESLTEELEDMGVDINSLYLHREESRISYIN